MSVDSLGRLDYFADLPKSEAKLFLIDNALLKAARRFDEEALTAIFDLYSSPLYSYALRLTSDELFSDFVVGDTFGKLLEELRKGEGPKTNLRSYLYQTTYHLIIDESRKNRREAPLEIADCVFVNNNFDISGIPKQTEKNNVLNTVFEAMKVHLTEDQQHVLFLRFLEDFSLKETAEIIGKEVNNIKVIQNRGLAKLRKVLSIQLGEE